MKQRGVLTTEWIDCWDCFQGVIDHFRTHESWKGRSTGNTYYAWRLGTFDGNDAAQFAAEEKPFLEAAICHPVAFAVLQGENSQVFHLKPRTRR